MLEPGSRLGPYEILSPAGAGGMGEVYKAKDTRLDRTVAIKVLPEHLSRDAALRERFEREALADISPDGQRFLMVEEIGSEERDQTILVLNWSEELKRLVPTQN